MRKLWLVLAASVLAAPALAQEDRLAELNRLLAAGDHPGLSEKILKPKSPAETLENLDWLQARWLEGNSAMVPFTYSRLLWSAANAGPPDADQLKQSAVAALLYVIGVTTIDGARCGDRTAPIGRAEKVASFGRDLLSYAMARSAEERAMMAEVAVLIERKTAAARDAKGDVAFMCRFGMHETTYNLRTGTAREAPPEPGQFGKQIILTGDGKYVPPLRDEKEWRPEADKARADLPALLGSFLAVPAGSASNSSAAKPKK